MSNMNTIMYRIKSVSSTRTHHEAIDIELFTGGSEFRAFLEKSLAMELIHKMLTALSTPFEEKEDTNP